MDVTISAQKIWSTTPAIIPSASRAIRTTIARSGLGYANLGALLMSLALPYDSDGGRDFCGAITALMTGEAYAIIWRALPSAWAHSVRLPAQSRFDARRGAYASRRCGQSKKTPSNLPLLHAAQKSWDDAVAFLGERFGYKNSQVSVLAPTGNIGFILDCDTTGIEPDLALVKHEEARRRRRDQDRQQHRAASL